MHTPAPIALWWIWALAMVGALGCRTDLGECDEAAVRRVVFLDTGSSADPRQGIPMYAGQALVVASCGADRFCHASSPNLAEDMRFGAPAGLSFDVSLACLDGEFCDEDSDGVARLRRDQKRVFDMARAILSSVESGWMPPDGVGERLAREHFGRLVDVGPRLDLDEGEELPPIGSAEGTEILRNWLACGAPVVESTGLPTGGRPGDLCGTAASGTVGDCRRRIFEPRAPEPRWSSIYEDVIFPMCGVACHGDGTPNYIVESALDLSSSQLAYDSIVGEMAAGRACAGQGILVDPGNSAGSLFLDKLTTHPICGDPMPSLAVRLDDEVIAVIAAWIDAGAPFD